MTNQWTDLQNSDCLLIIGSNAAVNHPIAFKWITKAMERGAKLICVDPRFTRTAARAHIYARLRPGTDIAFIGGIINYALENGLYHEEYVREYTNASFLVNSAYSFKDGLFSGYEEGKRRYDRSSWAYARGADGKTLMDKSLKDPNCVFQILKRHYSRYTAEIVSQVTGTPKEELVAVAKAYCETAKPGKAGTICYAMGTTQHTVGSQNVRIYAILQLLLGNIGVAGGGINALRGESNVQGSTDHGLLFDLLPGYLAIPHKERHPTLKEYLEKETPASGYWVNKPKFFVSLLKAFWGDKATRDNDFCYDYLPKISGNYSWMPLFEAMYAGKIKGLLCWGMNPAVCGPNTMVETMALERLDWLVVADLWETETASFWDRPGVRPAEVKTEVFLLPAAASFEKEGSITNSSRVAQWRARAINPPSQAKSDLEIINRLYDEIKALYQKDPRAVFPDPIVHLKWDYGPGEPGLEKIVKEINGYTFADAKPVANFTQLMADGSTSSGNWIYSGMYPEEGKNLMKRRLAEKEGIGLHLEWGFAWPLNRRIIYNRCSANPAGVPYNEANFLVKWDAAARKWMTQDVPDFAWKDAKGEMIPPERSAATPFIMLPEGQGRLFSPVGLVDGPLPEHYEPVESPVTNLLSPVQYNPAIKLGTTEMDKVAQVASPDFPIIATTFRASEHWQAGAMTRNLSWLMELTPELFVLISQELAKAKGIEDGDEVTIVSTRGEVKAIACATKRLKAFNLNGRRVEIIALPWHWGFAGLAKGDVSNKLTPHVGDANTMMPEYKVFLCDVRKGG